MESPRQGPHVRPVKRACLDCHVRKVKCDGATNGFPCSNCRSAQVQCTVAERRKRKRAPETTQRPRSRRRREAPILDQPAEQVSAVSAVRAPETPLDDAQNTADGEEETGHANANYEGESELARQHLIDFFSQDLHHSPIRARCTYVGNELSNLHFLTRQRSVNQHVYHYPCSNIYIPRVLRNSQTPATPNLIPKDAFVLPPQEVSDLLVEAFFTHIHPTFPIIDKEWFLSQYRASRSAPPILLIQAIGLAGSHVSAFPNIPELKVAFFRRTKALLDGKYEEDRMHVVQAALLLTWFSDGGDDICANAWWWIGLASRTAIGLGMHRDVTHSKMPEGDKRTWRMIWWCLVQFDCLVSLFYGRPQSINLDDCDVPPLRLEDFDASINATQAISVMQCTNLCSVVSDLVHSHFSVRARQTGINRAATMEVIDGALANWFVSLPPEFRDQTAQPAGNTGFPPLMLHLVYNTILIQFHRVTSPPEADQPPQSSSDGEICADAATNIIRIFQQLRQQSALQLCWFWAPASLFTAMLQVSGELKCSNQILNIRAKEKYESGLVSLRKLSRHWLFAASVLRLFQSNTDRPSQHLNGVAQLSSPSTNTVTGEQNTLANIVSPSEVMSTSTFQGVSSRSSHPFPQQEMEWVQPALFGDPNLDSMHFEHNRWSNNLNEWQSLYWSDPLANISLGDDFSSFNYPGLA